MLEILPMHDSVKVFRFKREDSAFGYNSARRIRYSVFVKEQGWTIPSDGLREMVLESEGDKWATFFLLTRDNTPVGSLVIYDNASKYFPTHSLFKKHFRNPIFLSRMHGVALLSGLAVLSQHREDLDKPSSIILKAALDYLEKVGKKIIFVTVGISEEAHLYRNYGFKVIDAAYSYDGPLKKFINMGLIINHDNNDFWLQAGDDVFADLEQEILGKCSFEEYVNRFLISERHLVSKADRVVFSAIESNHF